MNSITPNKWSKEAITWGRKEWPISNRLQNNANNCTARLLKLVIAQRINTTSHQQRRLRNYTPHRSEPLECSPGAYLIDLL